MADTKISALPASTTPLAGTEVLPIVQSSATKQVSVANLTAGRAISATQLTLTTGNLIVASGQGIDFSATSGTGTSELLADYEIGTWTPVWTGGTVTVTQSSYVKSGDLVLWQYDLTFGSSANITQATLTVPFNFIGQWAQGVVNFTNGFAALISQGDTNKMTFRLVTNGNTLSDQNLSTARVIGNLMYRSS